MGTGDTGRETPGGGCRPTGGGERAAGSRWLIASKVRRRRLEGDRLRCGKARRGQVALRLWVAISSVVFRLVPVEKESVS